MTNFLALNVHVYQRRVISSLPDKEMLVIPIPKNPKHALELDKCFKNSKWSKAMKN